eukprot:scaffold1178_cov252-Pinguiococcus_pyrenoidosus.AAC.40
MRRQQHGIDDRVAVDVCVVRAIVGGMGAHVNAGHMGAVLDTKDLDAHRMPHEDPVVFLGVLLLSVLLIINTEAIQKIRGRSAVRLWLRRQVSIR